jgi:hypothetical protein
LLTADPSPVNEEPVMAPALNSPDVPRRTIVEAPLALSAVVLAFAIVPLDIFDALIAVKATPLPEIEVVVIAFAVKFPDASLATMVDAPLAEAAVVRALSIVPLDMLLAFMAVKATPLPDMDVVVMAFAVKFPLASLATMVDAPLADDAVVLAFEIVPLDILLALMSVKPAPLPLYAPETVTKVPTFAAKDPFESLATMVEAPFAEAAVVRALAIVPALILDALIAVRVKPEPMKFAADTLPVKAPAPVAARLAVERFKAATLPVYVAATALVLPVTVRLPLTSKLPTDSVLMALKLVPSQ